MKTLCLIGVCSLVLLLGCDKQEVSTSQTKPKTDYETFMEEHLGQVIVMEGIAGQAKAGPVLEIDGKIIFIDVDGWPEGMWGKRVRVKGTLVKRYDAPVLNKGGRFATGVPIEHEEGSPEYHEASKRYLIQNPTYEILEPGAAASSSCPAKDLTVPSASRLVLSRVPWPRRLRPCKKIKLLPQRAATTRERLIS